MTVGNTGFFLDERDDFYRERSGFVWVICGSRESSLPRFYLPPVAVVLTSRTLRKFERRITLPAVRLDWSFEFHRSS